MDYDKEHGQVMAHLIGEVELGVGTFLVPGEKEIEVFHKDKHGHPKKAGHIWLSSEFIPIPANWVFKFILTTQIHNKDWNLDLIYTPFIVK